MIDGLLTAWLLLFLPAYNGWRGLKPREPEGSKVMLHWRTVAFGLTPLLILALEWTAKHRPITDLGLGAPADPPALVGLGVAFALIAGLGVSSLLSKASAEDDPKAAVMLRILPQARGEWPSFIAFCLTVGVAWEVLYRGYLLWVLSPMVGPAAAVAIAALAYGLAHGVKDFKRVAASLLAAALFTTAYAVTQNLWWLILIHTGLPLLPALLALRTPKAKRPLPA